MYFTNYRPEISNEVVKLGINVVSVAKNLLEVFLEKLETVFFERVNLLFFILFRIII